MGIIPKGTKLTPRDRSSSVLGLVARPTRRRSIARLMENYAGYMDYTDHQVGRLIDSLAASGELDNTLVMYVVGDNGASAEGGLEGTFSELASLLGVQLGLESTIKRIDEIGGPTSEPHVPVGWAWAMNAPFQWTKQVASHFGGTRNPLVVHWPKGIKAKGEIRDQFHHVIDVVPTILEACKIPEPKVVNGIAQKPIEGVSMLYSFDDAKAKGTRTTQYFEMATNRAIYHDGWVACSQYGYPWETLGRKAWISSRRRGSFTTSTRTSARPTISRRRSPRSSRSCRPSSSKRRRSTTCSRSIRASPSAWIRSCASPASRRRSGPTTATTSGCRSRSGRNSSRAPHTITAELTIPEGRRGRRRHLRRRVLGRLVALRQGRQAELPLHRLRHRRRQHSRHGRRFPKAR